MPKFQIIFGTELFEDTGKMIVKREGQDLKRVIVAPDKEIAEAIARAMLKEDISPTIPFYYLAQVVSVEQVPEETAPFLHGSLCDACVWERVLYRLRLVLDQIVNKEPTFEGFEYYNLPWEKAKRVGLKFTPAQRDRLISILPSLSL